MYEDENFIGYILEEKQTPDNEYRSPNWIEDGKHPSSIVIFKTEEEALEAKEKYMFYRFKVRRMFKNPNSSVRIII